MNSTLGFICYDKNYCVNNKFVSVIEETAKQQSHKVFGMPYDTASIVIPTFTSILVFVCGWIITVARERCKKRRELRQYRTAILKWIKLLEVSIKDQINQLKKLSEDICISKDLHPVSFVLIKTMANKINDISVERMLNSFVIGLKDKSFDNEATTHAYDIINRFDYLTTSEQDIMNKYKEYDFRCKSLIVNFDELWKQFLIQKDIMDYNDNHGFNEIQELYIKWLKTKQRENNFDLLRTVFIEPLYNDLSEVNSQHVFSKYCQKMLDITKSILALLEEWNNVKKNYGQVFSDYAMNIEQSYETLVVAKDYFIKIK